MITQHPQKKQKLLKAGELANEPMKMQQKLVANISIGKLEEELEQIKSAPELPKELNKNVCEMSQT